MNAKPTICIDFDGCLYLASPEDTGFYTMKGHLVEGAKEAMTKLSQTFHVVILSARARREEGAEGIRKVLKENGAPFDEVTDKKPPAVVYVDDYGVQFRGDWKATLKDIATFKHWHEPSAEKHDEHH